MGTAAANFKGEEDVDPFQGDRAVNVEEVHSQHGRGLRSQESTPGGVAWLAAVPAGSAAV
jgi:hypothetical protein